MVCAACGYESQDAFKFCPECGAPTATAASPREQRKTVTVVFCDVTGSTALGEQLDPESLRHVMARYFETMRSAIERHGGTVEKFIGDAVMAVFGVPVLHEDDALRAVRAAAEMQAVLGDLNEELLRDYGTTLALRIGVNTGEVVTGTEERLATGDAVNLAARLEQAAAPGDVLVGAQTVALVRGAVELVELPPIEVKGKSEPVTAHRLVRVNESGTTRGRRFDRPMVGRERELSRLRDTFEQATRDGSCQLFTVLGPAGIGKSRLVRAFLDGLEGARIVTGACLPYGDGITYWPVVEVVKQLLGDDPEPRLAELDSFSRSSIGALLGEDGLTSPDDTATAVRLLLEIEARRQPLVVVFDDIHWGERVFLDLIEYVADLARDAPLMLLCMARPELRELRTGWGGGLLNATTVLLEPLADADTDMLIDRILVEPVLGDEERAGILASAEGNPLFVEEMLAMREEGGGEVTVPPSIQALLAARLDALPPHERTVLELGAIEGQLFHASAVRALAPGGLDAISPLTAAVRKDLIRPTAGLVPGEPAYRFRHLLIRDAAYDGLAKAARADLHARYADWLDDHGGDLVEYNELAGYHREQAYRYRAGLGPVDDATRKLGERAAEQLADAGRAAVTRSDWEASWTLFRRAVDLLPAGDPRRLALLPDFGASLVNGGDFAAARTVLDAAVAEAREAGDERTAALATVYRLDAGAFGADPGFSGAEAIGTVAAIVERLETLGDDKGTASALLSLARLNWWLGHGRDAEDGFRRAVAFAERSGDARSISTIWGWWTGFKMHGPAPVSEVLAFFDSIPVHDRNIAWGTRRHTGSLLAMQGRFEEARASIAESAALIAERRSPLTWVWQLESQALVERYAGDLAAAEATLRTAFDRAGNAGALGMQAGVGLKLAEVLCLLGREEEAEELVRRAEAKTVSDDRSDQAAISVAHGQIALARGDADAAVRLARTGADLLAETDWLRLRADTQLLLARALRAAGDDDAAADSAREARRLYALKEHTVGVGWADAFLAASVSGAA